jgi:(p)ppGpp synthase/HD superfamily hydrolase
MDTQQKIAWIIDQHRSTNHKYGDENYDFHLQMAVDVFEEYAYTLEDFAMYDDVLLATWGHDLIEDTRTNYNDVFHMLGEAAADIIYAVTNEKGKYRKDRANEIYYSGIRSTDGATFVKLCDRIANVMHSKRTDGNLLEMYRKENDHFLKAIDAHKYPEMVDHLKSLLS